LVTVDSSLEETDISLKFSAISSTSALIFTTLHWMQGGLATRMLSVPPSVCPSVCQKRGLWQNERKIWPDFYTIRKIT